MRLKYRLFFADVNTSTVWKSMGQECLRKFASWPLNFSDSYHSLFHLSLFYRLGYLALSLGLLCIGAVDTPFQDGDRAAQFRHSLFGPYSAPPTVRYCGVPSLWEELPPPESFYIGSSSPDGGSGNRSVIVSDPSIQIPHVKWKCCDAFPSREITGPKNTQNWHHFTRTSSSTHSNYLCLLTLLHLILLSPFSM